MQVEGGKCKPLVEFESSEFVWEMRRSKGKERKNLREIPLLMLPVSTLPPLPALDSVEHRLDRLGLTFSGDTEMNSKGRARR